MRPGKTPSALDIGYTVAALGYIVGISVLSGSSGELGPSSLPLLKLLHLPLFAGLAASVLLAVTRGQWTARVGWRTYAAVASVAALVAVLDEYRQTFTLNRLGSVGDVALDWVGIATLLLVHHLTSASRSPAPPGDPGPPAPAIPRFERKTRAGGPEHRASGATRH
jgi:hypothetical protein